MKGKGDRRSRSFLPPAVSQFVIPDQNRFPGLAEAWVDVERDVVTAQEVIVNLVAEETLVTP